MRILLELVLSGIMVGSIYALVALGWTLIYKCSGVLNLAMGELTLIGAYVCLTYYQWGFPFPLALVGFIWGTDTVVFTPPVFPQEPLRFYGMVFGQVYLWSFVAAIVLLVVFVWFFQQSRWGLSMQATADDEMAALSLGVSAKRVYALAWAIAFMAAGVGGTLLGDIYGLNISVGAVGLLVLPP